MPRGACQNTSGKELSKVCRTGRLHSGVMYASLDTRMGILSVPLDPLSDGAMILRDMNEAFACLQIFSYRFPYFRYFRTPSWKRFERAMDDFSV